MKTKQLIGILTLLTVASMLAIPVFAQKTQTTTLTADEVYWLEYIREEEKLARDVYIYIYNQWGSSIFSNIAASEQTHMDKVKGLLDKYDIADPAEGNGLGEFDNEDLQDLYTQLITDGSASKVAAFKVGVFIELTDIADLQEGIDTATRRDIRTVYTNLMQGSYNHLAAFESQLAKIAG